MHRVEIIARGDVQRVGYRDAVQKIARHLGLSGTVQNVEPYDVRIVAEGDESTLKEFVKALKIQERPIWVQELEVTWAAATGEFEYFKILRGDWQEELGERFDVAVGLLHRSIELGEQNLAVSKENLGISKENLGISKEILAVSKENLAISKENLGISKEILAVSKENLGISKENLGISKEILAVSKENLGISKENLGISKEILAVSKENLGISKENLGISKEILAVSKENLSIGKVMLEKQDETIEELRGVRSDLREHMDRRFARIEGEIAEIKRAIRELGGSCI